MILGREQVELLGRSDLLGKLRAKVLETPEHPDKGLSCLLKEQPIRLKFSHKIISRD